MDRRSCSISSFVRTGRDIERSSLSGGTPSKRPSQKVRGWGPRAVMVSPELAPSSSNGTGLPAQLK
jgi:hypothetical protein